MARTDIERDDAQGDAKFTWVAKLGQYSHAERVGRPGNTVCGQKVGRDWLRAEGRGHRNYAAKCGNCAVIVKRELRRRARALAC